MQRKIVPQQSISTQRRGFTIVELLIVVVVIAILAAITIVAYNGITQQANEASMYSTLAQWRKKAELYKIRNDIVCPDNYIFVYGNSTLGTSDFCVMKYEAKNDGSGNAVSTASGTPWVSITQTAAITTATASGGHLITEAEWMTIAADILSVKYNWSGGEVGSVYVYQGHVNSNPATALAASSDDRDPLNGMTGGFGTSSGTNSKRVLYLTSGEGTWDFSGNVYEWTQQAIGTPTYAISQVGTTADTAFTWREWVNGSFVTSGIPSGSRPAALTSISGLSLATTWGAYRGVGNVFAHYNDAGSRAFVRSGSMNSGPNAGVLALNLAQLPSTSSASIGFRVAR